MNSVFQNIIFAVVFTILLFSCQENSSSDKTPVISKKIEEKTLGTTLKKNEDTQKVVSCLDWVNLFQNSKTEFIGTYKVELTRVFKKVIIQNCDGTEVRNFKRSIELKNSSFMLPYHQKASDTIASIELFNSQTCDTLGGTIPQYDLPALKTFYPYTGSSFEKLSLKLDSKNNLFSMQVTPGQNHIYYKLYRSCLPTHLHSYSKANGAFNCEKVHELDPGELISAHFILDVDYKEVFIETDPIIQYTKSCD